MKKIIQKTISKDEAYSFVHITSGLLVLAIVSLALFSMRNEFEALIPVAQIGLVIVTAAATLFGVHYLSKSMVGVVRSFYAPAQTEELTNTDAISIR